MLYKLFTKDKTSIIFGDLDLTKFQMMQRKDNGDILLYQRIEKSSDNTSNNDILSKIITKIKNNFPYNQKNLLENESLCRRKKNDINDLIYINEQELDLLIKECNKLTK